MRRSRLILAYLLGGALLFTVAGLLLFCPVAFAIEGLEMIRMSAVTEATIESVAVERGGKHRTTRPIVNYRYSIGHESFQSSSISPGIISGGAWTGGGAVAARYSPGDRVEIHYDANSPADACLLYGWHKFTLIGTAFSMKLLAGILILAIRSDQGGMSDAPVAILIGWFVPAFFSPAVVAPSVILAVLPLPFVVFLLIRRFPVLRRVVWFGRSPKSSRGV